MKVDKIIRRDHKLPYEFIFKNERFSLYQEYSLFYCNNDLYNFENDFKLHSENKKTGEFITGYKLSNKRETKIDTEKYRIFKIFLIFEPKEISKIRKIKLIVELFIPLDKIQETLNPMIIVKRTSL